MPSNDLRWPQRFPGTWLRWLVGALMVTAGAFVLGRSFGAGALIASGLLVLNSEMRARKKGPNDPA